VTNNNRRSLIENKVSFGVTDMVFAATGSRTTCARLRTTQSANVETQQPVANNRDNVEAGVSVEYGNIRGEF